MIRKKPFRKNSLLVLGAAIALMNPRAQSVETDSNPLTNLPPAAWFKAFIQTPLVIEQIVFREKLLADPAQTKRGIASSTS